MKASELAYQLGAAEARLAAFARVTAWTLVHTVNDLRRARRERLGFDRELNALKLSLVTQRIALKWLTPEDRRAVVAAARVFTAEQRTREARLLAAAA